MAKGSSASTQIRTFPFESHTVRVLDTEESGRNWPVVYILGNSKYAYVGETTSAKRRLASHLENPNRKKLEWVHIIEHPMFNKSATLDTEAWLIEYISGDGSYILQNNNKGLRNHNYYNKIFYKDLFLEIWDELRVRKIVKNTLRDIENGDLFKYSPFKSLTDDQAEIVASIEKIIRDKPRSVSVVSGEPGSGKTILAIYLVKYLLAENDGAAKKIGIVLPQTSLRETVRKVFRGAAGLKVSMVLGPNDVANMNGEFDVLIVDEAHRLAQRRNLASYSNFDSGCEKLGLDSRTCSQVDWMLAKSRHTILLYDANQTVRPSDAGRDVFDGIKKGAFNFVLSSQMRVLAGDKYSAYIEGILRNSQQPRRDFPGYDLRVFDRLGDMLQAIRNLDRQYGLCRVVAGYAWDWVSKDDKHAYDIEIQGHKLRWNSTVKDWINSASAVTEVGCIHTVQGYDLNYVGVIIGPELTYEKGSLRFHPDRYKDRYGKHSSLSPEDSISYIINIYKTLLTRGIKGAYVFACDEQLRTHIAKFVPCHRDEDLPFVAEKVSEYGKDVEK